MSIYYDQKDLYLRIYYAAPGEYYEILPHRRVESLARPVETPLSTVFIQKNY